MKTLNRRQFLKHSAWAGAALSLPLRSWAQVAGANDTIRMAVVGFNGQGKSHIEGFRKLPGVRIVALCDCDRAVLDQEARKFTARNEKVETYLDVRRLLENQEIDAISTATPNHWHALISIWACQAGKDVYVEKPVSHNVWEGRKIVEASRKYNRIVQTGTQSRSSTGLREAIEWVRQGNLGKIKIARGLCYKPRQSIGKIAIAQTPPETVDYNLWCGPAPKSPLLRLNLHYDWHWVWATGSGDLGNQGIHQMDICRWALGKDHLSPRILSVGGRFGYLDDGETPNTQFAVHDYGDVMLIFEVRGLPSKLEYQADGKAWSGHMDKYRTQGVGHVIECEGGYLAGLNACDSTGKVLKTFSGETNHHANFIKAVRSRNRNDLNADILEGHLSSALCHTANISYRLGKQAGPEAVREAMRSDSAAQETLTRFEEHLAANGVDLRLTRATLGAYLKMDQWREVFIGNRAANRLLRRDYRKPFVVPERV